MLFDQSIITNLRHTVDNVNGQPLRYGVIIELMNTTLQQRLRESRELAKLSRKDAAKRAKCAYTTLADLENGYSHTCTFIGSLAEIYGVNAKWLETGKGSRTSSAFQPVDIRGVAPLISWVSAGKWMEISDELQPGEGEYIKTTYRVREHTYALRVNGDSMEPKFPNGCIIFVEPDEEPTPGKYVIVRQNGDTEATFKQLIQDGGTLYLKPLNDRYPILAIGRDAVFCGVVKKLEMDV